MDIKVDYSRTNTLTGEREFSHSYDFKWSKTDLFCPGCGKSSIWSEEGSGDYYVGVPHICIDCETSWYLATGCEGKLHPSEKQVLEQIKAIKDKVA